MKPSVAILEALKTYGPNDYLCLLIDKVMRDANPTLDWLDCDNLAFEVKSTFMPTICSEDTTCLTLYLARSNRQYDYYANRYGHDSKACYTRRVAWWHRLVQDLQERGL